MKYSAVKIIKVYMNAIGAGNKVAKKGIGPKCIDQ